MRGMTLVEQFDSPVHLGQQGQALLGHPVQNVPVVGPFQQGQETFPECHHLQKLLTGRLLEGPLKPKLFVAVKQSLENPVESGRRPGQFCSIPANFMSRAFISS